MSIDHASAPTALAGMPDAQALLLDVESSAGSTAPDRSRPIGVVGVAGSGTGAVLDAVSAVLRRAGREVVTDVPTDPEPGTAVVVHDIHARDPAVLRHLATLTARPDITVVVGGEPRDHSPEFRDLFAAIGARGRVVTLAPLTVAGVVARSSQHLLSGTAAVIARASGGNRDAVDAALDALTAHGGEARTDPQTATAVAVTAISAWHHRVLRRLDRATLGVLVIAAAGATPDPDTVVDTCDLSDDDAHRAIDAARGSGFLGESDTFLADAQPALAAVVGAHQITATRVALVRVMLRHNTVTADRAIAAATDGMVDSDLADALVAFARDARGHRAVTLWTAARAAGADRAVSDPELARVALETDDLDIAARIADEALATDSHAAGSTGTVATGVRIGAAVAARRGTYSRAAQLFRWLGADRADAHAAVGVVALIGSGDRAGAAAFLDAAANAAPTTENTATALLASGLVESLTTTPAAALGAVLRAMSLRGGRAAVEPESAAVVATLIMLHSGDLSGARATLDRVDEPAGTTPPRLQLLRAWTAMMAGDLTEAAALAASVSATCHRDRLLGHAVAVGIARRRGDPGTLAGAWRDAQAVVAESEVDLFALLPLGELWVAAVRCGDSARFAHLAAEADRLLTALGEPPVWAAAWHWYGVQAAILADAPAAMVPHARALGLAAETSPHAAVLARAGRVWLRLLQGDAAQQPVEVADIDAAAYSLHDVGHSFDGARLAAEGALRVDDTRSATALLQTARLIGGSGSTTPAATDAPHGGVAAGMATLSDREAEVAEQLVLGLTYREIGAALFISAKTVEHHVARIRRRLGSSSRSELLSTLRAAGYGAQPPTP